MRPWQADTRLTLNSTFGKALHESESDPEADGPTTPVNVWLYVGLWRSATKNPGGWAMLVKVYIVISAIRQLFSCLQLVS